MTIMTLYRAKNSAGWAYSFDAASFAEAQVGNLDEIRVNVPDPTTKIKWDGTKVLKDPAIPGHFLDAASVADLARRGQRDFSMANVLSAA